MRPLLYLLLAIPWSTLLSAEEVAVHPGVTEKDIDVERVTNILLGRVTTWGDGNPAIVIVSLEASADQAMSELLGRDTDRLLRGWKRLVYSGSGAMPTIARSNMEAITLVARTPGSIVVLPAHTTALGCRIIELKTAAH